MIFKQLIIETETIIEKGWIQSLFNGTGGLGITLEKMLNIPTNQFEIPDYNNIEIKTKLNNKQGYISLFNATPDSFLFEIKRIQQTYGYPDAQCPQYKVFNISVYANRKVYIGKNLFATLKIDNDLKKVYLLILDSNYNVIDCNTSWSFGLLFEKINRKLKNLFLVFGEKKTINKMTYYKYLKYKCYIFKNFNTFLRSLEKGEIRISFKIGVIKKGEKKGKLCDHGTSFDINVNNLASIYHEIVIK